MPSTQDIILIGAAYGIGSIPFGLLIVRLSRGVDLRQAGSGNIGSTNALRVAGKIPAALTVMGDVSKGCAAVWMGRAVEMDVATLAWVGFAVIAGHAFPFFLGFKGGKGVATGFGVFLGIAPRIALTTLPIWLCGLYLSGYSSVGALAAAGALPLLALLFGVEPAFIALSVAVSVLIYFRHMDNIRRLLKGVEKGISHH